MTQQTRRRFLMNTAACSIGACLPYRFLMAKGGGYPALPEAAFDHLPRWRGFNLLNYFMEHEQYAYEERVFQGIADFGFNIVRIPLDYRCWIEDKDWNRINSEKIDAVLKVLEYGEKYSIHVMLNFHRAPGYTVAWPQEKKSLWTDSEAQDVCCRHWAEFARRCKGIPNSHLSFNLFNEPNGSKEEEILPAAIRVMEAIRAEDADRLIVCDGLQWGRTPIPGLIPYSVAQAARGYDPMDITHYQAEWIDSRSFSKPRWPMMTANGLLVSPHKSEVAASLHRPLTVEGPFEGGERIRLKVQTVSDDCLLMVEADGKEIFRRPLTPGKGNVEWKEEHWQQQWNIWQNLYDLDVFAEIPAGAQKLTIYNAEGDWISLSELGIIPALSEQESVFQLKTDWSGTTGSALFWNKTGEITSSDIYDQKRLWDTNVQPWVDLAQQGVGVMVGEFGVTSKTPHDVALRWLEDNLANWKKAGFGWAMWNWNGGFGVADSGRTDADYENKYGWQIDKKMMALLQRY